MTEQHIQTQKASKDKQFICFITYSPTVSTLMGHLLGHLLIKTYAIKVLQKLILLSH